MALQQIISVLYQTPPPIAPATWSIDWWMKYALPIIAILISSLSMLVSWRTSQSSTNQSKRIALQTRRDKALDNFRNDIGEYIADADRAFDEITNKLDTLGTTRNTSNHADIVAALVNSDIWDSLLRATGEIDLKMNHIIPASISENWEIDGGIGHKKGEAIYKLKVLTDRLKVEPDDCEEQRQRALAAVQEAKQAFKEWVVLAKQNVSEHAEASATI